MKSNNDNLYNGVTHSADSTKTKKSASNKDKLSLEYLTTEYSEHLQELLRRMIKVCEYRGKVAFDKNHEHENIDSQINLKEELDKYLFWHRSKLIKSALAAHKQIITHIEKNYKREIKYSKGDKYMLYESPAWMMKDKKIVQTLEKFPLTIPILNYLWNYNRFTRGKKLDEMVSLTANVTGGKKHKTKTGREFEYEYATFVTNETFYKNMAEKIGCSINYLQKYFTALCKIGVIKKLGNVGRNGTLYADGYYIPYRDSYRKEVFLNNNGAFNAALRSFDPLANKYIQDMKFKSLPATRDDIVKAARMLNKTELEDSKLKTSKIDIRDLKKEFIAAYRSITSESDEEIPDHVANVYNKLTGN